MALIQLTATEVEVQKSVMFFGVNTEVRNVEDDPDEEESRSVARIVVRQLAWEVTGITNFDGGIVTAASVTGSPNGAANVVFTPGLTFTDWRAIDQRYGPENAKGSLVYFGEIEYVSVTAWAPIDWTA